MNLHPRRMFYMDKTLTKLTTLLIIIGALHLGLVGVLGIDLLGTIFGTGVIMKTVYVLVGMSAILHVYTTFFKKVGK